MIYTVIWLPAAVNQLANFYLHATDKMAVTLANHRIDKELRIDPDTKVTPCGKFWIFSSRPVDVLCDIDAGDRKVQIIQVRLMP